MPGVDGPGDQEIFLTSASISVTFKYLIENSFSPFGREPMHDDLGYDQLIPIVVGAGRRRFEKTINSQQLRKN